MILTLKNVLLCGHYNISGLLSLLLRRLLLQRLSLRLLVRRYFHFFRHNEKKTFLDRHHRKKNIFNKKIWSENEKCEKVTICSSQHYFTFLLFQNDFLWLSGVFCSATIFIGIWRNFSFFCIFASSRFKRRWNEPGLGLEGPGQILGSK